MSAEERCAYCDKMIRLLEAIKQESDPRIIKQLRVSLQVMLADVR